MRLAAAAAAAWLAAFPLAAQEARLRDARIALIDDVLILETRGVVRSFDWNEGWLIGRTLEDPVAGQVWTLTADRPDAELPGIEAAPAAGRLTLDTVPATALRPAHLRAVIETRLGAMQVRRTCEATPGVAAIRCGLALRGAAPAAWSREATQADAGIETDPPTAAAGFFTDRLALPGAHWRVTAVRFTPRTDANDTLVHTAESWLFRNDQALVGNLLAFAEGGGGRQAFIYRESPAAGDQLGWSGHDARARIGDVRVSGSGFEPADLSPEAWTEAYAVTVGVAAPGETALLGALRAHQETRRVFVAGHDAMILSNTWGDRSRDSRMTEAFMLAEVDAAAALGVTHVQLDDGWQAGLSRNSASRAGERWEDWSAEDWRPHPERFPAGLAPIVARARERDVQLGLWFNPSRANDYAKWRRDADILIGYWRDHGIATVKIDGVEVPTKAAERNLRAFYERVVEATDGQLVFNLDVTAGRRPGYHFMTEYGNLFLENRYTDWANYYPHRTLRNLWMLSAWVPAQSLQIEFLNPSRNPERYGSNDPLAPSRLPADYPFAVAMAAQPLAWMEVSNLDDRLALARSIETYRGWRDAWQAGRILPIGEEPDGAAWTGFQSIADDRSGHLIVYRETLTEAAIGLVRTRLPAGAAVRFEPLQGEAESFEATVGADGAVPFALARPSSYAVYRYVVR